MKSSIISLFFLVSFVLFILLFCRFFEVFARVDSAAILPRRDTNNSENSKNRYSNRSLRTTIDSRGSSSVGVSSFGISGDKGHSNKKTNHQPSSLLSLCGRLLRALPSIQLRQQQQAQERQSFQSSQSMQSVQYLQSFERSTGTIGGLDRRRGGAAAFRLTESSRARRERISKYRSGYGSGAKDGFGFRPGLERARAPPSAERLNSPCTAGFTLYRLQVEYLLLFHLGAL